MMKFLFASLVMLAIILLTSRYIENARKSKLLQQAGTANVVGEAAKSLRNEEFRIRESNREKGIVGEIGVASHLDSLATNYGLTVLHDLSIPGSRANIDHVLVTSKALFVIDSKNYKGLIKIHKSKNGLEKLTIAGRDQTALAEKLLGYTNQISRFLETEGVSIKVVPLLAFYRARFHEDSLLTIKGVTVNIYGIENELLRYANLKTSEANMEYVANKILEGFPQKN
jgi:hypothetical protein